MNTRLNLALLVTAFVAISISSLSVPASAQPSFPLTIDEPGFVITDLGNSTGPKGAECSPGGIWGDYIYIGESSGNAIDRIDFLDNMFLFATGSPEISFPVGMDFGQGPAANFGDFLYVASYGSGQISRVDPSGTPSLFTPFPFVSDVKFDPSGVYSTDLFAITYFGAISTVTPGGVISPFAPAVNTSYFRFGPGGAWGTGMYATSNGAPGVGIITVDGAGTPSLFAGVGFVTPEQFDWAFGGSFGGDMFATDLATSNIWRIKPDGTQTIFGNADRPAGMVFCNGCLYITTYTGGCYKVCEAPVSVEPSTWGAIKATYGTSEKN